MKTLKIGFGFLAMVFYAGCATTGTTTLIAQPTGGYEAIAVDIAKGVDYDSVTIIGKGVVCDTNAKMEKGIRLSGGKTDTSMASILYIFSNIPQGTQALKVKVGYKDLSKEDPVAGILAVKVTEGEKAVYDHFILRRGEKSEEFILTPLERYIKDKKVMLWITAAGWDHLEVKYVEVEYLKETPPQKEKRIIYQNRYWQAWNNERDCYRDIYFYFFPGPCYWRHRGYYVCYRYDPCWYWYTWRPYCYRAVVHHIYVYRYYHHPHYHYYDCDCDYDSWSGPLASVGAPKEPLAVVGSPRGPFVRIGRAADPSDPPTKNVSALTGRKTREVKLIANDRIKERRRVFPKDDLSRVVRERKRERRPAVYNRDYVEPKRHTWVYVEKRYQKQKVYRGKKKYQGDSRRYYRSGTRRVNKGKRYIQVVRDQKKPEKQNRVPQKPRNSQKPKNSKVKSR